MWDLIVSVPDHCLSFYLATNVIITFVTLRLQRNVLLRTSIHARDEPYIHLCFMGLFDESYQGEYDNSILY